MPAAKATPFTSRTLGNLRACSTDVIRNGVPMMTETAVAYEMNFSWSATYAQSLGVSALCSRERGPRSADVLPYFRKRYDLSGASWSTSSWLTQGRGDSRKQAKWCTDGMAGPRNSCCSSASVEASEPWQSSSESASPGSLLMTRAGMSTARAVQLREEELMYVEGERSQLGCAH